MDSTVNVVGGSPKLFIFKTGSQSTKVAESLELVKCSSLVMKKVEAEGFGQSVRSSELYSKYM